MAQLCEYFAQSVANMTKEVKAANPRDKRYAQGLVDMMHTIAEEIVQLGKYEAQRRMIENPEDLFGIIDKYKDKE